MALAFPSHSIDPKEKGEEWIKQMAKAMLDEFDKLSINSFYQGSDRYAKNRLYALGKQGNDIYKPMFELSDDKDSSYMNLDLQPPAILPKFLNIIDGKFSKIQFRINAQAIDHFAMQDKEMYEATERANIQLRGILKEAGIPDDILNSGEVDQPQTEEELAIKMEFGYKHNDAIDIEKKIDAVFTENRIKEQLSVIRKRLKDSGAGIFKAFTDTVTGRVGFRVVEPENWVCSPTNDQYFSDIWYAGEMILMTIHEIRKQLEASGVDVKEENLEAIATKCLGQYGNGKTFSNHAIGSTVYDSVKVPVFDFEFLSTNENWYEKRWTKRGNPVVAKAPVVNKEKKDREYYKDEEIVVYRGKWIKDTEYLFDYGMKSDMYRKPSSIWDTRLSYIACAPDMHLMETNPIIETMIPIVDQITIAWYKLQNVIAKARPKGISIEIGALEDITLGDANDPNAKLSPMSVLDMYTQSGVLVYRKIDAGGNVSNAKPIEELNNGMGTEAGIYFDVIQRFMGMLREIIGMNDVTDGSTPDPKTLNGVASMMAESTANAIQHLLNAERFLVERLADEVAVRVHDSMMLKENSPYKKILSPQNVKSLKESNKRLKREYNLVIEYDADSQELIDLRNDITIALQTGQITLEDSMYIKNIRNIKQAQSVMAYRIKKKREKDMEQAMMQNQQNAEANMMAARAAEEEKRKTIDIETQSKIALIEAEKLAKIELMEREYELKNKLQEGINTTKIQSDAIKAEAAKSTAKIKKTDSELSPI